MLTFFHDKTSSVQVFVYKRGAYTTLGCYLTSLGLASRECQTTLQSTGRSFAWEHSPRGHQLSWAARASPIRRLCVKKSPASGPRGCFSVPSSAGALPSAFHLSPCSHGGGGSPAGGTRRCAGEASCGVGMPGAPRLRPPSAPDGREHHSNRFEYSHSCSPSLFKSWRGQRCWSLSRTMLPQRLPDLP